MDENGLKRVIQESVPGKQITLSHTIANPDRSMYEKLGILPKDEGALGILAVTPTDGAIIAADIATKTAMVKLIFVDRFSGFVIISGSVESVEAGLQEACRRLKQDLQFTLPPMTQT